MPQLPSYMKCFAEKKKLLIHVFVHVMHKI